MELHSYAKRRATPKKWTIEQKRKLVEARIAYDALFSQKPRESLLPWKKILSVTNLDDYNVFFVRKQWSNMVAKYKQYKQIRLGDIPTQAIDDEMIQKISLEWEFFAAIHEYMMRKTRNLHSYALQINEEPILEPNSNSNSTQSSTERINIYSSDTNDVPASMTRIKSEFSVPITTQNTDHDFYSKKWVEQQQQQHLNYFADASEDTQESSFLMEIKTEHDIDSLPQFGSENEVVISSAQQHQLPTVTPMDVQQHQVESKTHVSSALPAESVLPKSRANLSERDRYYRHKRRFNHRFERRFDAILQVVGQVVKAEYPTIDVSPLLQVANAAAHLGENLNQQIFSSGDEFDEDSEEEPKIQKSPPVQNKESAKKFQSKSSRWYITPE